MHELTLSLQRHVHQDVHSIIDVSRQLQILEDLNADYILLFLPGNTTDKILQLERARLNYARQWNVLRLRLNRKITPDNRLDYWVERFYRLLNPTPEADSLLQIKVSRLVKQNETRWLKVNDVVKKSISAVRAGEFTKARHIRDTRMKSEIQQLRNGLTQLNRVIGRLSIGRSQRMARISQKTQSLIWGTEIGLIFFALLIAFVVARWITKPIEVLKNSVRQMAMYDFNVHIPRKTNDEIGALSRDFEQLSERLRQADRFKTAMLSQFTHEMKSPLGSIKQATQLLERSLQGQLNGTQKRFLELIKGNYETLQKMITNILHTTAYDIGQVQLKYRKVNLVRLMAEQLVFLSPVIKEKGIKVNIGLSSKKIECEADAEKIKEVVRNLVSNSVKFSAAGTQIDIQLNEKFPLIYFRIKDQGIGIPQEEIPYIFEKMYRASNSEKISVKGTGLGLYIVSRIIRAHGGRIKVKSEVGKGSEFLIILPKNRKVAEEGGWLGEPNG